jgi:hypothetical protein
MHTRLVWQSAIEQKTSWVIIVLIIKLKAKIFHVAWWSRWWSVGIKSHPHPGHALVISEALQYSTGLCSIWFLWWEIAMLWTSILKLHEIKIPIQLFSGGYDLLLPFKSESSSTSSSSTHPTDPTLIPSSGDIKPSCSQIRDGEGISKGTREVQQTIRPGQRFSILAQSAVPANF